MWIKLSIAAALFLSGWLANGWRLEGEYAKKDKALSDRQTAHANHVKAEEARLQKLAEANDAEKTERLQNALAEIETFRARVGDGSVGLRVAAKCPAAGPAVPAPSSPTRVDDAAGPRLTDAAQRDYFTLRQRIEVAGQMIAGLQQHIREQCLADGHR